MSFIYTCGLSQLTFFLLGILLLLCAIRMYSTHGRSRSVIVLVALACIAAVPAYQGIPLALSNQGLTNLPVGSSIIPVLRLGFTTPGDVVPIWYYPSSSGCSLNSGNGDNGSQVKSADNKCWLARFPASVGDITEWGADASGTNDSTTAINSALSAGLLSVYVPPGTFKFGAANLTMPATPYFVLFGVGPASQLIQTAGYGLRWSQSANVYSEQTVHDLKFVGTNGSANTVDTTGAGGVSLRNLYFTDVPTSHDAIYMNGAASAYVHDQRLSNIQIYYGSAASGNAAIEFGPYFSDGIGDNIITNCGFSVAYCMEFDNGSMSTRISSSHIYNAGTNDLYVAGSSSKLFDFIGTTFDNANSNIVSINGASSTYFTGDYIEAIQSGNNGILLNNTSVVSIYNTRFGGSVGAASAVAETGTSDYTKVIGGDVGTTGNYTSPFVFIGSHSYSKNVVGVTNWGSSNCLSGITSSAQAQNTTEYLGANGAQSSPSDTVWTVPAGQFGTITAFATVGTTPAAGQTYTFQVYGGAAGTTPLGAALVVNNGGFGGNIITGTATSVNANDQISIQSVFSATSGSSTVRYWVCFNT